jgi:hypothetical protein
MAQRFNGTMAQMRKGAKAHLDSNVQMFLLQNRIDIFVFKLLLYESNDADGNQADGDERYS